MCSRHAEEAKWKRYCKSIVAMLCKRWRPCYQAMIPSIQYRCQLHRHHFPWNLRFRHSSRRQYLVRQPPTAMPFSSSNSNSTPNDSWPHRTRALAIYRQSYSPMESKTNRMAMATDAAVPASRRNDTRTCNEVDAFKANEEVDEARKRENKNHLKWKKHWNNVLWIAFVCTTLLYEL